MSSEKAMIMGIIDQAPEGTTELQVVALLNEHKGNVVDVLARLWDTPAPEQTSKNAHDEHWANIRDICDSHDAAMEEMMSQNRDVAGK